GAHADAGRERAGHGRRQDHGDGAAVARGQHLAGAAVGHDLEGGSAATTERGGADAAAGGAAAVADGEREWRAVAVDDHVAEVEARLVDAQLRQRRPGVIAAIAAAEVVATTAAAAAHEGEADRGRGLLLDGDGGAAGA